MNDMHDANKLLPEMKRAPLQLLITICDWDRSKKLIELFQHSHVLLHYQCKADGTANSEILDMLGIGQTDKVFSICVAPKTTALELLNSAESELRLLTKGHGIAFTVPLSGVSTPVFRLMDEAVREKILKQIESHIESEVEKMKCDSTHCLILTAINQGFSEELMEAARGAGAGGGTVIPARSIGQEASTKLFGIAVQGAKEIVAILAKNENKLEIMKAIGHRCGINTEAQGVILALPVDSVAGISG